MSNDIISKKQYLQKLFQKKHGEIVLGIELLNDQDINLLFALKMNGDDIVGDDDIDSNQLKIHGIYYMIIQQYDNAFECFKKSLQFGNKDALLYLGILYYFNYGNNNWTKEQEITETTNIMLEVKKWTDKEKMEINFNTQNLIKIVAFTIFNLCVRFGCVIAPYYLGLCYDHGYGIKSNHIKAYESYKKFNEKHGFLNKKQTTKLLNRMYVLKSEYTNTKIISDAITKIEDWKNLQYDRYKKEISVYLINDLNSIVLEYAKFELNQEPIVVMYPIELEEWEKLYYNEKRQPIHVKEESYGYSIFSQKQGIWLLYQNVNDTKNNNIKEFRSIRNYLNDVEKNKWTNYKLFKKYYYKK
ncbi:MAG: hypothetical protein Edafosvirus17_16 [Edafosvirus sp.]|uniref:Tetratricopeptide repeat protein n=1 Tax=Edafosvirus sp. TaxID=2487765 RepID=A0A3G4ZUG1_9VIRU|nr:MAG: hypothetical protein Edafosvirus17_16 [Edafosvirus sp.]